MSFIGLILGLFLIASGAFWGWGSLPLSLAGTLIVALTSSLDVWEAFSVTYLTGYTNTFFSYFLIFTSTCLYSKLMAESGCAVAMAYKIRNIFGKKHVMTTCCVTAAVLNYAGVSAFVLSYVMIPIMWTLFKEADIPRELTICPIIFGCSTWVLSCIPGSEELTNLNPALALGTPLTAAPVMGICCAVFLVISGLVYSNGQVSLARKRGEHFQLPEGVDPEKYTCRDENELPSAWKAFLPTVLVVLIIIIGSSYVENTTLLIVCAMIVANIVCFATNFDRFKSMHLPSLITQGVEDAVATLASFAAIMAFAAVAQTTSGFGALIDSMMSWDLPVYVKTVLYTAMISCFLGSSAAGSRVAINSISDVLISSGANLEVCHRLTAIASTTVDTLPHCAALFGQMRVLRLPYRGTYKHIFHLSVVQTTMACIGATVAALIFY